MDLLGGLRSFFKSFPARLRTQSLILQQMLRFEGGLNLGKVEADVFFTVTIHNLKDNLSNTVIQILESHVFMFNQSRVCVLFRAVLGWCL